MEVHSICENKTDGLNDLYRELAELIGYDNTMKLYSYYKGQQVTFPIRLFKVEYVKKKLQQQYNGKNIKMLARTYGYSERWVRKLVNDTNEKGE